MKTGFQHSLIPCESCGHEISPDVEVCPKCGAANTWVHPTLERVIAHLSRLPHVTEYEALGHRMNLIAVSRNPRQQIGEYALKGAMVLLIIGFFYLPILGLALLFLAIGGAMTGFGMNAEQQHHLAIDLRKPGKTVGRYDQRFWADVITILKSLDRN